MNRALNNRSGVQRLTRVCLVVLLFAFGTLFSQAFTTVQFIEIQSRLTNDIAILSGLENPTREDRNLLRTFTRAGAVLAKTSGSDGKTVRGLNSILARNPSYTQSLANIASNLLAGFHNEHQFVGSLLPELPPSPAATLVATHYDALEPLVLRLNEATSVAKFSAIYDATKLRLDNVFAEANRALLVPFPSDISTNTVKAKINGVNFTASSTSASENTTGFNATVTGNSVTVVLHAVNSTRGVYFSVLQGQSGTFRYVVPQAAVFTNRTDIDYFSGTETAVAATNGAIFVSTTSTEVYGIFSCSGPNFNVTEGRFRITLSSQE